MGRHGLADLDALQINASRQQPRRRVSLIEGGEKGETRGLVHTQRARPSDRHKRPSVSRPQRRRSARDRQGTIGFVACSLPRHTLVGSTTTKKQGSRFLQSTACTGQQQQIHGNRTLSHEVVSSSPSAEGQKWTLEMPSWGGSANSICEVVIAKRPNLKKACFVK